MSSSSNSQISAIDGLASQFGVNLGNNDKNQVVYTELIKSRTLTKNMLKRKFNTERFGPNISLVQIFIRDNYKGINEDNETESKSNK